jgi:hypothetical protein
MLMGFRRYLTGETEENHKNHFRVVGRNSNWVGHIEYITTNFFEKILNIGKEIKLCI